MYSYTFRQWLSFFYFYCIFGWCFESAYVSLKQLRPVNRGFLKGPWLPLYGSGAILVLWMTLPFQNSPVEVYVVGLVGATVLEYFTGEAMVRLFKVRYWDYSNQPFNLNGYICLSSSITWGFFTILMNQILHPPVEQIVEDMFAIDVHGIVLILVSIIFVADVITSAKAAFDVAHALEAMEKIRNELENIQVQMALLKKETSDYVEENLENVIEKVDELKLKAMNAKEVRMNELLRRKEEFMLNKEKIVKNLNFVQKGLLRGNPGASAGSLEKSLKELKETTVDMFSTVFIGNKQTKVIREKMVTPRGYRI